MSQQNENASVQAVLEVVSKELSKIAAEIEELDLVADGKMSAETIVSMQSIDFCSQRLADISALATVLSKNLSHVEDQSAEEFSSAVKLEHTQDLLQAC